MDSSEHTVNIEGLPINEVETTLIFHDIEMERLTTGNITIGRRRNLRRVQTPESSDNSGSDTPRNSENRGRNLQRTYNFRRNFQMRNNQGSINDSNQSRISNMARRRRSVFYTRRSSTLNSVGEGSYSDCEK